MMTCQGAILWRYLIEQSLGACQCIDLVHNTWDKVWGQIHIRVNIPRSLSEQRAVRVRKTPLYSSIKNLFSSLCKSFVYTTPSVSHIDIIFPRLQSVLTNIYMSCSIYSLLGMSLRTFKSNWELPKHHPHATNTCAKQISSPNIISSPRQTQFGNKTSWICGKVVWRNIKSCVLSWPRVSQVSFEESPNKNHHTVAQWCIHHIHPCPSRLKSESYIAPWTENK